jgi:hypothetical protein
MEDGERCEALLRIERELDRLWGTSLEAIGCIACARLHLVQSLQLRARAAGWAMSGEPSSNDYAGAPARDAGGVSLTCKACETLPGQDAVRFFRDGTDEFR